MPDFFEALAAKEAADKAAAEAAAQRPTAAQYAAVTSLDPHRAAKYAQAALDSEIDRVRIAHEGTRNHTLNVAAFNLGQLVAGGDLDQDTVTAELTRAALLSGLAQPEIAKTIASGLKGGAAEPRIIPDPIDTPIPAVTEITTPDLDSAEQTASELFPRLDWHALWADEEADEWIIEPLLPARRLVALYSAPKVGKSLLMLELAVAISRGSNALGVPIDRPRNVLYIDFENDPRGDVKPRLEDMGYGPDDLDNLHYLSFPTLAGLDSLRGAQELLYAVNAYQCEVVVIDTVSRAVVGEENENDTWLAFYRNTGLALKQAQVACIRLDHTGKDHDKGMRGGSAKYGDVDAVWKLSKVTETTYRLDCEANRLPINEKNLVLHRETDPLLRHRVDGSGHLGAWEAAVTDVMNKLDSFGLPDDAGRDKAREALKANGVKAANNHLTEAIRRRKIRLPGWST